MGIGSGGLNGDDWGMTEREKETRAAGYMGTPEGETEGKFLSE
jgi:hypothetical protein